MSVSKAPSLLVLRALGLGDFLTGVPAYRAIADAFPTHRRTLAAPAALHALVPLLGAVFSDVCDAAPLGALPARSRGVDVAIDLHGRGPQSHRALLALGPQRLLAFANDAADLPAGGAAWIEGEHEVYRWCRMLRYYNIAADPSDLQLAVPSVAVPAGLRQATIVHPGAASEARRWPIERWAAVARACMERGERVVVTGAPDETSLTSEIARRANLDPANDVAGRTSLIELAALIAAAERVLCGDTGVAHLASAYAVPSVLLFGPTSPAEWGPPQRPFHRVIWAGDSGDPHAPTIDRGLLAIEPIDVLNEIERLRSLRHTHVREEGRSKTKSAAVTSSSAPL